MTDSNGRSSVAACVFEALEALVGSLPNTPLLGFDHLPDDQSQWPALAVQTLQETATGRSYADGGSLSRCVIGLTLRSTGDEAINRIEACELLDSIASALQSTPGNPGKETVWHIESRSQPYLAELGPGRSDYRVTLAITYRTHL